MIFFRMKYWNSSNSLLYWFSIHINIKYAYIESPFTHCFIQRFHGLLNLKNHIFRGIVVRFHHTYTHAYFCIFTSIFTNDTLTCVFFKNIYFCFMNDKSLFVNFQKEESLQFESILAHVILLSGCDLNTDRSVNIWIQCGVRLCVLCIVVCVFFCANMFQ